MTDYPLLRLKKNEDRRLRGGHLWVFSNEVDVAATPLKGLERGTLALLENARGEALGVITTHADSLIAGRLLTRDPHEAIDQGFFQKRFERALRLREGCYGRPFYRLIFGESDGLPGLIVDRFGDVVVVQTNTAGMERLQPWIFKALEASLSPRAIILRNTSSLRSLEGLEPHTEVVMGSVAESIEIEENGARFLMDPLAGQKTGWFFDHRDNRALLSAMVAGKRVLDLFSYTGAWAIPAALQGARSVDCVDASAQALELALQNALLNGVSDRLKVHQMDVFDFLKAARESRDHFDVIIVDPPAFIKRKKDHPKGFEAYRRLNQMALQILSPGGLLVSASCSFHLSREQLQDLLRAASRHLDRHLVLIARGGQAKDHPIHPAIPETDYLKAFFCHVGPSL